MKNIKLNLISLIIISCLFLTVKTSADEKKEFYWDLLRDIRDYQAGRLHFGVFPGTKIQIKDANAPVVITYAISNAINAPQYFYFDFPKILRKKNIQIELNFKWPNSKGILMLAFAAWSKKTINSPPRIIGTLLKFGRDAGFYTGNIRYPLLGQISSKAYSFANIKEMGITNHVLLINITQDRIESTLDSKHLSWKGNTSPTGFAIVGYNMTPQPGDVVCIEFNKFIMNIDLNTNTKEK